jgi:hypothetical protein
MRSMPVLVQQSKQPPARTKKIVFVLKRARGHDRETRMNHRGTAAVCRPSDIQGRTRLLMALLDRGSSSLREGVEYPVAHIVYMKLGSHSESVTP